MFIPFERFSLKSDISKESAISVLSSITDHRKIVIFNDKGRYFKGNVNDDGFKIERIIGYRNSFLPVIIGRFEIENRQLKTDITMRFNLFVFAFCILWLMATLLGSILVLVRLNEVKNFQEYIPIIMFLLGILLFTIPFKIEANIARNKLREILGKEI